MSDITHGISTLFVHAISRLETGKATLDEVIGMIDAVAVIVPGDERQSSFYQAVRELANKVQDKDYSD